MKPLITSFLAVVALILLIGPTFADPDAGGNDDKASNISLDSDEGVSKFFDALQADGD
jgi:hypothetical protein